MLLSAPIAAGLAFAPLAPMAVANDMKKDTMSKDSMSKDSMKRRHGEGLMSKDNMKK
jgi:pentapeptide MXKDX repeat protein